MSQKYTVEYNDETQDYEVVEWEDTGVNGVRAGITVSKTSAKWRAQRDCEILNEGFEYALGEMNSTEFDEVTV